MHNRERKKHSMTCKGKKKANWGNNSKKKHDSDIAKTKYHMNWSSEGGLFIC